MWRPNFAVCTVCFSVMFIIKGLSFAVNKILHIIRIFRSYQERAEKYEGDEVEIGEVGATATLVIWRDEGWGDRGIGLTLLTSQTR